MGETEDFDIPLFGYGGNIESQRLFQNDNEFFEIFTVLRLLKLFYIKSLYIEGILIYHRQRSQKGNSKPFQKTFNMVEWSPQLGDIFTTQLYD